MHVPVTTLGQSEADPMRLCDEPQLLASDSDARFLPPTQVGPAQPQMADASTPMGKAQPTARLQRRFPSGESRD